MIGQKSSRKTSWKTNYTSADFERGPMVVFYEVTRACDLVCQHCRANAERTAAPGELDTPTALALVRQLSEFPKPPLLILTGGDPFKRRDLEQLVAEGTAAGLGVALTPSATPLVTARALRRLRDAGLMRLAISVDGADALTHDAMRGVRGSFDRSMEILADARSCRIPLQVNTTITAANFEQIDAMAEQMAYLGIVLWSVFFLVPVGRGVMLERITPEQYEYVFQRLWHHARHQPYAIKTTEAPHYRRFVARAQAEAAKRRGNRPARGNNGLAVAGDLGDLAAEPTTRRAKRAIGIRGPVGTNDGKGTMFVSHAGVICPSGFLPVPCGRFPRDSVVDVYRNAPLFRALRDPDRLGGKCRACSYRHICGGSRARSYALTGDVLAAEPDCLYVPEGWEPAEG